VFRDPLRQLVMTPFPAGSKNTVLDPQLHAGLAGAF
jgi:hypothetical protein